MRQIGTLAQVEEVDRFVDYLLTQKIRSHVEMSDGAWEVWILEEDDVPRAREEFAAYQRDPLAAPYREAAARASAVRREAARREKEEREAEKPAAPWQPARRTPITWMVLSACLLVAISTSAGTDNQKLIDELKFSTTPDWAELKAGQLWRLVTPIFLHFNLIAVVISIFVFRFLGLMIESRRGSWRFLVGVLLIAVAGNVAEGFFDAPRVWGLSGVNLGLIGYALLKGRIDPVSGIVLERETLTIVMFCFFLGLFEALPQPGQPSHLASNLAHTLGAVGVGLFLGWLDSPRRTVARL